MGFSLSKKKGSYPKWKSCTSAVPCGNHFENLIDTRWTKVDTTILKIWLALYPLQWIVWKCLCPYCSFVQSHANILLLPEDILCMVLNKKGAYLLSTILLSWVFHKYKITWGWGLTRLDDDIHVSWLQIYWSGFKYGHNDSYIESLSLLLNLLWGFSSEEILKFS